MRNFIFALAFFSLFLASFASVESIYQNNGLKISRTLENVRTGSISTTTGAATYSPVANIVLTITNTGVAAKENVQLIEELYYVPSSSKLSISPMPAMDGKSAMWNAGTLLPSQQFTITINATGKIDEDAFRLLPSPSVSFTLPKAILSAPKESKAGQQVRILLSLENGTLVQGALLRVVAPDGAQFEIATDSNGEAAYSAQEGGFYTYSSEQFSLQSVVSTNVIKAAAVKAPAAGALIADENAQEGILPFALGLAVLAAVAVALYMLFSPRTQQDAAFPPSSGSAPSLTPSSPTTEGNQREAVQAFGQNIGPVRPLPDTPEGGKYIPAMQAAQPQQAASDASSLYQKRKSELEQKEKEAHELLRKASVDAQKGRMGAKKPAHKEDSGQKIKPAPADDSIEKTIAELEKIRSKLKAKGAA